MSVIPTDELHTITQSISGAHLGQAIDSMRISYDRSKTSQTGWDKMSAHQYGLSSIMHAFCFLESLVNFLSYELLFDTKSNRYIPEDQRKFPLRKLVGSWKTVRCLDKIKFVLEEAYRHETAPNLLQKLEEINTLRNWIMHGFTYTTTMLLEQADEELSWHVHDTEDNVEWGKKFPANKFNPIVEIDYSDSQKVLSVILEVCKPFFSVEPHGLSVSTTYPDQNYKAFFGEDLDFTELLSLPPQKQA